MPHFVGAYEKRVQDLEQFAQDKNYDYLSVERDVSIILIQIIKHFSYNVVEVNSYLPIFSFKLVKSTEKFSASFQQKGVLRTLF